MSDKLETFTIFASFILAERLMSNLAESCGVAH